MEPCARVGLVAHDDDHRHNELILLDTALSAHSEDCNRNGIPDECDVRRRELDCNRNDIPDECEPDALEDCDGDGTPNACESDCDGDDVPDAASGRTPINVQRISLNEEGLVLTHDPTPEPDDETDGLIAIEGDDRPLFVRGNTNGVGGIDITDAVYVLNSLFLGGPKPPSPHPDCGPWGNDTDPILGCWSFPDCQ